MPVLLKEGAQDVRCLLSRDPKEKDWESDTRSKMNSKRRSFVAHIHFISYDSEVASLKSPRPEIFTRLVMLLISAHGHLAGRRMMHPLKSEIFLRVTRRKSCTRSSWTTTDRGLTSLSCVVIIIKEREFNSINEIIKLKSLTSTRELRLFREGARFGLTTIEILQFQSTAGVLIRLGSPAEYRI